MSRERERSAFATARPKVRSKPGSTRSRTSSVLEAKKKTSLDPGDADVRRSVL
jgi:hypothetical protein